MYFFQERTTSSLYTVRVPYDLTLSHQACRAWRGRFGLGVSWATPCSCSSTPGEDMVAPRTLLSLCTLDSAALTSAPVPLAHLTLRTSSAPHVPHPHASRLPGHNAFCAPHTCAHATLRRTLSSSCGTTPDPQYLVRGGANGLR